MTPPLVATQRHAPARSGRERQASVALAGFLCLFAAQAGLASLGPVLSDLARDFGTSTAAAGQLRTIGAGGGALAAAAVAFGWVRIPLRGLLYAGAAAMCAAAAMTAAAPSMGVLAVAQVGVGAAAGVLTAAGLAAAVTWVPRERRGSTLAWVSLGQPASWIFAMPLVGAAGEIHWRLAALSAPFMAGAAAFAAVAYVSSGPARAARARPARLRWDAKLGIWALGELFAYGAWSGTLVFAGSLMIESYDASPGPVGALLGLAAVAALPGNLAVRRYLASPRETLVVLGFAGATLGALFGAVRPSMAVSTALFALMVLVACSRTIAGSAFAGYVDPSRRLAAMGVRAASGQLGYLLGPSVAGAALATGGYEAMGAVVAVLFALGALPHALVLLSGRMWPAPTVRPALDSLE